MMVIGLYFLCAKGGLHGFGIGEVLSFVAALFYVAVACTIGGYMLQNVAVKHVSSKIVGIVQSIYPIATAIMAYFILNEKLSLIGMVGAFIIGACIVIENVMISE